MEIFQIFYLTQAASANPDSKRFGCSDKMLKINVQIGRTGEPKQTTFFCSNINLNKISVLCFHLNYEINESFYGVISFGSIGYTSLK